MPWTTEPTFVSGQIVGASDLNTYLRDDMNFVFNGKALAQTMYAKGSDYTTTSTSMVDIDATNLALTITVTTGRVRINFAGYFYSDSAVSRVAFIDVLVDGTSINGGNPEQKAYADTNGTPMSFTVYKTGLSAASHTFKLQWKMINPGTLHLVSDTTSAVLFSVEEF